MGKRGGPSVFFTHYPVTEGPPASAAIEPRQMVWVFVPRHATTQVAKCYMYSEPRKAVDRSSREQRPGKGREAGRQRTSLGMDNGLELGDVEEELPRGARSLDPAATLLRGHVSSPGLGLLVDKSEY